MIRVHEVKSEEAEMTYTTGLTLAGQELQLFCVTKLDKDVDRPFFVILVLADANFTCTTDACGARK